ncbi:MAG: HNH endonuclease [Deltaproteobacteria bacterium]|nr:MAG: HNH endonuclease [Deltaproteobacteria bacterium]
MSMYIPAALRHFVRERAEWRCEYCLVPESAAFASYEMDHIIAQKHGGLSQADNLALSCALCNKHKGSDLASLDPETGDIVALYHPRRDKWTDHFLLSDAQFIPLTQTGRVTVRLLQLNAPERLKERELLIRAKIFHIS